MWIQSARSAGLAAALGGLLVATAIGIAFPAVLTGTNMVLLLLLVLGLAWVGKTTYDAARPGDSVVQILHDAELTADVPAAGGKAVSAGPRGSA
jgi:hypothetical protein